MNFNFIKENPDRMRILVSILLGLGLLLLVSAIGFGNSAGLNSGSAKKAAGTRTAIALTAKALLGPFPTSTAPTLTPSQIPTVTFTPSLTPTLTPSRTPTRFVFVTSTPRIGVPHSASTAISAPTSTNAPAATQTPAAPSDTPVQPSNTSAPISNSPTAIPPTPVPSTPTPIIPTLLP